MWRHSSGCLGGGKILIWERDRAYAPQCPADNYSCPFEMTCRKGWVTRHRTGRSVPLSLLPVVCWRMALQIKALSLSAGSPLQTRSCRHPPRGCKLFQGLPFLPRNLTKSHKVSECPDKSPHCAVLSAGPGRPRCSGRDAGDKRFTVPQSVHWAREGKGHQTSAARPQRPLFPRIPKGI